MNQNLLKEYARLAVRSGVNLQQGQELKLFISVEQHELARLIVAEAYEAGAAEVTVEWQDDPIERLAYEHVSAERLGSVKEWQLARLEREVEVLPALIHVVSTDPEKFKGIDPALLMQVKLSRYLSTKKFKEQMDNKYQWTVIAAPSAAWARKVFPELSESESIEKLWALIFSSVYLEEGRDVVAVWEERNRHFSKRSKALNDLQLKELHLSNALGTDFKIGLLRESIWLAGGETSLQNIFFNANLPTEECFTTPDYRTAEGVVFASMPLSVRGALIDRFWIRFEAGRAVAWGAEVGEDVLRELLATDEGAASIGELALVPASSPIKQSGVLFYNTLFDENAACHLALGEAYTSNVKGYTTLTKPELHAMGVNESAIHEDFMIGTADLRITGRGYDGREHLLMEAGEWAFEL